MSTASIEIAHPITHFPSLPSGDFADFEMGSTDELQFEPLPIPLLQVEQGLPLYFDVPAFRLQLVIPIIEVESDMNSGRVVFKATIEEDALLILTGTGKLNEDGDSFKIEHVNLHIERLVETASADFIVSTFRAALVLADDIYVRIPSVQLDLTLRFDEPLLDISHMLRRRQIDYRIMVIERTVGHEFHLPLDITGDEVRNIALAYHAIIDSSFDWPINSVTLFFPAAREWADTLTRLRQERSIPIGPDPFSLELFEHQIDLGKRGIIIQDAVINNYETVQREMSKDDGQVVPVVIRSTSGQARYDFFGVPKPSANMWNPEIQRLVELESQLDATLIARYHALAAATLDGLTEKEKAAFTVRPELDEELFLMDG